MTIRKLISKPMGKEGYLDLSAITSVTRNGDVIKLSTDRGLCYVHQVDEDHTEKPPYKNTIKEFDLIVKDWMKIKGYEDKDKESKSE